MDHPAEELLRNAGPTLSVDTYAKIHGVSTTLVHDLINSGELGVPVIHLGKRRVIPTAPVRRALGIEAAPEGEPVT